MPDFSHLKEADVVGDKAVPYQFSDLAGTPRIWFIPGTNDNPVFLNETLRRSNARAAGGRARNVTSDTVEAARQEDREVIAKTCAKKWDVKDAAGKPVEFSEANCLEFFEALPNWLFDGVRNWVTNPANFIKSAMGEGLGEG